MFTVGIYVCIKFILKVERTERVLIVINDVLCMPEITYKYLCSCCKTLLYRCKNDTYFGLLQSFGTIQVPTYVIMLCSTYISM